MTEDESERERQRSIFEELNNYSLPGLKMILKCRRLPTSGLKEDLVRRLQADLQQCPFQLFLPKESDAILSEKLRKQTADVKKSIQTVEINSISDSFIQKEAELYRKEAELNLKEKELAERELALAQKELEKIRQVQVNTDARTQERNRYLNKLPSKDRHSDATSVSRRDESDTKQRTERERDWPKMSRRFNHGQRDHPEANYQTRYNANKYFKCSERRERVVSEYYKRNEERRSYDREKPESRYSCSFRRNSRTETPAQYWHQNRNYHQHENRHQDQFRFNNESMRHPL